MALATFVIRPDPMRFLTGVVWVWMCMPVSFGTSDDTLKGLSTEQFAQFAVIAGST
jgi:hypothetical protein